MTQRHTRLLFYSTLNVSSPHLVTFPNKILQNMSSALDDEYALGFS